MSALPTPQPSFSPEIVPALDEVRPQIGPNLAQDPDFCREVLEYCYLQHVYPQILQQELLHEPWRRIDDAYRVKGEPYDLDISAVDPSTLVKNPDAKGRGGLADPKDGKARVFPATFHKQVTTKTDLGMSLAWNNGLPVQARPSKYVPEDPLYCPTAQSCAAANEELERCAREIGLKREDRKGRGSQAKYGHAWAHCDFRYSFQDVPQTFRFPADPQMAQALLQAKSAEMGQPINVDPQAMTATWMQRVPKEIVTTYKILRVDDVFIDQTVEAKVDEQMCPAIRGRKTRSFLFGNDYDPEKNPFGWVNTQAAMSETRQQWSYDITTSTYQQELQKKWGLSTAGQIPSAQSFKHHWTMYPLLGIGQDPTTGKLMLDKGDGVECPMCQGHGKVEQPGPVALDAMGQPVETGAPTNVTCPSCEGRARIFLEPTRYVVEAFGNFGSSATQATCLRIQELPSAPGKKAKVPLLFTATLTEDMAGAIPLCKSEAALKSIDQEATARMQWFDAKNGMINPPWLIPEDADDRRDYNRPNGNIRHFGTPSHFLPMRQLIDPTQNLIPFMQAMGQDVQQIMGANDTLLGEIQSGRRSASEIQNAFDSAKTPIVIEVDSYGEDMLAGWAQMHLDNLETWADRDWIMRRTGRTTFGKVQLHAAVADEYMKRQAAIANMQYVASIVANIPGANMQPILSAFCELMKLPVNADEVLPDGGMKKARDDGMKLVTQILGNGQFIPASPSDPHDIYIHIFEQALKDPYWQEKTPETLMLLQARLQMQVTLQMKQQQAMMAAQVQQMAMQAKLEGGAKGKEGAKGGGNKPPMGNTPPATAGGANQQLMGSMQS